MERIIDELASKWLTRVRPDLVGITIPFPGCFYGALRVARQAKCTNPAIRVVAGGGYVNTELRHVNDPRLFDYFDFLTYDDGELPLLQIVKYVAGLIPSEGLIRTKMRLGKAVVLLGGNGPHLRHRERPTPDYRDLPFSRYCPVTETINPMARLWTERRWLKLVLAYGCYWRKCAFCDTSLDYICRYDPADVTTILRWIRALIEQTGETGFHFADEAAPPHLLRRLAEELLRQRIRITWWTNIRFEKAFTPALARLLAASGCIAVTGGIECAQEDLLKTMVKGITLPEAARAMHAFARAGIMVHSYLMYGFPGQTVQQTVDALEVVRQLFQAGCLHSAFWHRFALTVHSRIFAAPARFGIKRIERGSRRLAENEVVFSDGLRVDHAGLGDGLRRAVYNFMHGVGYEEDVRSWFSIRVPPPRLPANSVQLWLESKKA
ncbi:MAG: B12-binding domain-containing radical SAM protein [Kiritimatiellia bacterium]